MKRVVITGMGIYSCLGNGLDEVKESLYNGKSGIVFDPERKAMGFRSALTAKLAVPDLKKELSRNQRVYMPEQAKYAYVATSEALKNAKIDQDYLDSHEVGLLYGNDLFLPETEAIVEQKFLLVVKSPAATRPSAKLIGQLTVDRIGFQHTILTLVRDEKPQVAIGIIAIVA